MALSTTYAGPERRMHIDRRQALRASDATLSSTASTASTGLDRADRRSHEAGGTRSLDLLAMLLMIIGGVNWGLVGLFQYDVVAHLFGDMTPASRTVYVLVGLAALYGIVTAIKLLRRTD